MRTSLGWVSWRGTTLQGEQLGAYPDHELPAAHGRCGADVLVRRERESMTPLATGRNGGSDCQWRNALLFAAPGDFGGGGQCDFCAEGEAYRSISLRVLPDMHAGNGRRRWRIRWGTARSPPGQLQRAFPVMGKTGTCSNNGTSGTGGLDRIADTPNGKDRYGDLPGGR